MDIKPYSVSGSDLTGPSVQVGDRVERVVVFLHGYGANGDDLISLAQPLGQGLNNCLFISPNAPEPLPAVALNSTGRQWYALQELTPEAIGAGAAKARPVVDGFLSAVLAAHELPPKALSVLGFSQGCMMALETCYRRDEAIAAVIGFSGALPKPEDFQREVKAKPPALLVHGTADPVVPFHLMSIAAQTLASAGIEVQSHALPGLPHGIDQRGLQSAYLFLNRHA